MIAELRAVILSIVLLEPERNELDVRLTIGAALILAGLWVLVRNLRRGGRE